MTIGEPGSDWSVAPPLRPSSIFEALAEHQVDYVIIGGFGAQLHQAAITTDDLDITPERSNGNLSRLAVALRAMDARLRAVGLPPSGMAIPLDGRTFAQMTTVTFITAYGPLDIALRPDGTEGYEDLMANASTVLFNDLQIHLAALADIIRSKEASGREKDHATLPGLRERLRVMRAEREDGHS